MAAGCRIPTRGLKTRQRKDSSLLVSVIIIATINIVFNIALGARLHARYIPPPTLYYTPQTQSRIGKVHDVYIMKYISFRGS